MSIAPLLHPQLRRLPPEQWRAAVREARRAPLDILELVAMAVGLIAAAVVMRWAMDEVRGFGVESLFAGGAVAGTIVGMLLVRRTRRGLRRVLGERD